MPYCDLAQLKARRFAEFMRAQQAWTPTGARRVAARTVRHRTAFRPTPFVLRARIKAKEFAVKLCRWQETADAASVTAVFVQLHRLQLLNEIDRLKDQLQQLEELSLPCPPCAH